MKKILFIFGTRPEAIKMAPLIKAFENKSARFHVKVCVTAQHRQMLDQVLTLFDIVPDYDLNIMKSNQDLYDVTADVLLKCRDVLKHFEPDLVLVHGDTTTTFTAALAAFYQKIPVGHVEAGLRTFNMFSPWPEEMNRTLTSKLVKFHFAPTAESKKNLLRESVPLDTIHVTGNTVIDALLFVIEKVKVNPPCIVGLPDYLQPGTSSDFPRIVLITGHRRENFGKKFENFCMALRELAKKFKDVHFVYPVHLNPNVRQPAHKLLKQTELKNVHLIEPLPYSQFIAMMNRSCIILTDSGGVQEEAPSLGKPVLVIRENTERPEAVKAGTVKLIGTNKEDIISSVSLLLEDDNVFKKMSHALNPYGDGKACERIIRFLDKKL